MDSVFNQYFVLSGDWNELTNAGKGQMSFQSPNLVLHWFYPVSFFRMTAFTSIIIIFGYMYETLIGTAALVSNFVFFHSVLIGMFSYFGLTQDAAIVGVEPTMVQLLVLMHQENPRISQSDIQEQFLKFGGFEYLEVRWVCWLLFQLLFIAGGSLPGTAWEVNASLYFWSMIFGLVYLLRYPNNWKSLVGEYGLMGSKGNRKTLKFVIALQAYTISVIYLPVTSMGPDKIDLIQPSMWQHNFVPTFIHYITGQKPMWMNTKSLVYLGHYVEPMPEAMFIIKCSLAMIPISVLLMNQSQYTWGWIPKVYAGGIALTLMYAMQLKSWGNLGTSFLTLAYLIYQFIVL